MTCAECLDELDMYTQRIIDGAPIDGVLVNLCEYLESSPCTAQFNLVLETLQAIEESQAAPVTSTGAQTRRIRTGLRKQTVPPSLRANARMPRAARIGCWAASRKDFSRSLVHFASGFGDAYQRRPLT
jgi:hypothetical protein